MEDEVVDVGIRSTTNYDMFKMHPAGRKISKKHLGDLTESIKKQNHLDCSPILVNLNLEIVSGQHRFLAAKQLGVTIYYAIRDSGESQMRQIMGHFSGPSIYHDDWHGEADELEAIA